MKYSNFDELDVTVNGSEYFEPSYGFDASSLGAIVAQAQKATSSGNKGISTDIIQQGLEVATTAAQTINALKNPENQQARRDLKSVCGKKPLLTITQKQKKKKREYDACVKKYRQAKMPSQSGSYSSNDSYRSGSDDSSTSSDNKKILGMPKGVAITVGVVAILGVSFLVYKKFIQK